MPGGCLCNICDVTLNQGQTLTAATVGLPGSAQSGGRTMLWLEDSNGNVLTSNWNYQNSYNSRITFTVPASGTYSIIEGQPTGSSQISVAGTSAGFVRVTATVAYTISTLSPPPPALPPPPPRIQYNQCPQFSYYVGQSMPGFTNMANGVLFASCNMNLNAGQVLQFGAAQLPGAQSSGTVMLWLRNPSNSVLTSGIGSQTPLVFTIPTSGQYNIGEGCTDWRSACGGTVGTSPERFGATCMFG